MMGMFAASSLSVRLRRLEACVCLLSELSGRLKYLQPTVQSLVVGLAAQERFGELRFLKLCAAQMEEGADFSGCWRQSLKREEQSLGREEAALMASLGDVLGRSDLESQLSAISLTGEQFAQRMEIRRERAKKQEGLYRSMGVLGGVAAAIILI